MTAEMLYAKADATGLLVVLNRYSEASPSVALALKIRHALEAAIAELDIKKPTPEA